MRFFLRSETGKYLVYHCLLSGLKLIRRMEVWSLLGGRLNDGEEVLKLALMEKRSILPLTMSLPSGYTNPLLHQIISKLSLVFQPRYVLR